MRFALRSLSVFLSAILVAGLPIQAQDNSSAAADIQEIHLKVIGAGQASATPGKAVANPLIISVTDGNNAPVPSATVLIRLPIDGASGTFNDGTRVAVLYTDMKGQASLNGIHWGSIPGIAAIRITASKGDAHAGMLYDQQIGGTPTAATASAPSAPVQNQLAPAAAKTPIETAATPPSPQPGQPRESAQLAKSSTMASSGASPGTLASSDPDAVVINNHPGRQSTGASASSGKSNKKSIWIAVGAAAAAGAAVALAGGKGGSSPTPSTPASTTTTIGAPSVSIGH